MKKQKSFLSVVLAFSLLLSCLVFTPVTANANENTPTAKISGHNLALGDSVSLVYYIKNNDLPSGSESGLLLWDNAQDSYTYSNAKYKLTSSGQVNIDDESYERYEFKELTAKQMTDEVYAMAYIKAGNEYYYSSLDKYSVIEYSHDKLSKMNTNKEFTTLRNTINSMLKYGASSQKQLKYKADQLATDSLVKLSVENGTIISDSSDHGMYKIGDTETITTSLEGFTYWETSDGAIFTDKTLTAVVGENDVTYTAKNTPIPESFTITWNNYDGTELGTTQMEKGSIPVYYGALPTRPDDEDGTAYSFGDWEITLIGAYKDMSYTAHYALYAEENYGLTFEYIDDDDTDTQYYVLTGAKERTEAINVGPTYNDGIHGEHDIVAIPSQAFQDFDSLVSVNMRNSRIDAIGDCAFAGSKNIIKTMILPSTLKEIGRYALRATDGVALNNGLEYIDGYASDLPLKDNILILPDSLRQIYSLGISLYDKKPNMVRVPSNIEYIYDIYVNGDIPVNSTEDIHVNSQEDIESGKASGEDLWGINIYNGYTYLGNEAHPYLICCGRKDSDTTDFTCHPDTKIYYTDTSHGYISPAEHLTLNDGISQVNVGRRVEPSNPTIENDLMYLGTKDNPYYACFGSSKPKTDDIDETEFVLNKNTKVLADNPVNDEICNYVLPEGLITIGRSGPYNISTIKTMQQDGTVIGNEYDIIIPSTVKNIGTGAFTANENVSNISLPDDVLLSQEWLYNPKVSDIGQLMPKNSRLLVSRNIIFYQPDNSNVLIVPDRIISYLEDISGTTTRIISVFYYNETGECKTSVSKAFPFYRSNGDAITNFHVYINPYSTSFNDKVIFRSEPVD